MGWHLGGASGRSVRSWGQAQRSLPEAALRGWAVEASDLWRMRDDSEKKSTAPSQHSRPFPSLLLCLSALTLPASMLASTFQCIPKGTNGL